MSSPEQSTDTKDCVTCKESKTVSISEVQETLYTEDNLRDEFDDIQEDYMYEEDMPQLIVIGICAMNKKVYRY